MKLMIDIPDNEEAIKKIVELCEYKAYNYTVLTDEVIKKIDNKALYKAIEALKNEPFLIDALHKAHAEIKEMERPQDKWITFGDEEKVYVNKHCSITVQKYKCPKCNGIIYIPKDYLVIYKFCPQCGEKMLKEKVTKNESN